MSPLIEQLHETVQGHGPVRATILLVRRQLGRRHRSIAHEEQWIVSKAAFPARRQTDLALERHDPEQLRAYLDNIAPESMGKYKM